MKSSVLPKTLDYLRKERNRGMADCDLSIYNTDTPCPDCGNSENISIRLCSGQSMSGRIWKDTCMEVANYTHLHRKCPECEHRWLERVP